jgi:hypothetical protein
MEKNTSPAKSGITYGVLFGAIMILEFVLGYAFKVDPASNPTFGTIMNVLNFLVLPILFIYISCNDFKMKLNDGFLTLGNALKIGVTVCIIAAVLYSIFSVIFNLISPEYMNEMYDKVADMMVEKNPEMTQEQIEMSISMMKKFSNPAIAIPATIVMYAFIGLIYSLIIGAIIKKEPNQGF